MIDYSSHKFSRETNMKTTRIGAALLILLTLTGATVDHAPPVVSIGSMSYDLVTYTAAQTVRIYREQPANIVVKGVNVNLASASQIVTTGGAPAPGLTATIIGRQSGQITVLVNSTSAAAYADYNIRVRYPVETNGPDVFRVRLYQRGTIGSLTVEGGSAAGLVVGTSYTLVATGTNLERIGCCGNGLDAAIVSTTMTSRTSTSARFTLVMKQGYGRRIQANNFFDSSLPSAPAACGTACYRGSGSIDVQGLVSPRILSATPSGPAPGSAVSLNGSGLAPRSWTTQLQFLHKYVDPSILRSGFHDLGAGTNTAITLGARFNMRSDSLFLVFVPTGSDAEGLVTRNIPVPPIFVKEPPVVAGTNALVLGATYIATSAGSTPGTVPYFLLKPGTAVILGKHLLSPPTSVSAPTTTTTTRTGATGLVVVGSPLPPTASFGSTTLPVQSAVYSPTGMQPVLSGSPTTRGVDRVTVTVPDLGSNQSGTISVTTAAGTATLPNVIFATAPRVTRVDELGGAPTASGSATGKLVRGAQYHIVGTAMQLLRQDGGSNTVVQNPTVKLNGLVLSTPPTAVTGLGTKILITIPATASSGSLTVETAGGIATAGTFTVIDAPIAPTMSGFVLAPNPIIGGATTTATVAFSGAIPADGSAGQMIFTIAAADQSAVPAIAPLAITANPMIVPVPTRAVTATRSVAVNVALSAANATSSGRSVALTLHPPQPTALALSTQSITGGQTVTGTVQVNASVPVSAGVPVTLTSSDPTTATVPATATVNGTSATFSVTTFVIPSQRTVTITATAGGVSETTTLVVTAPSIGSVSTAASRVVSGRPTTGTVTLTAPITGATAQLTASSPSVGVPASVAITGTTATFPITTFAVQSATPVTITATVNGVARTSTFTLDPIVVQSVTISPSSVPAGGTATVTVRLSAPSVGVMQPRFSWSDSTAVSLPIIANFAEGQDVTVVALTAKSPIAASKVVTVTATSSRVVTTAAAPNTSAGVASSSASASVTVTP